MKTETMIALLIYYFLGVSLLSQGAEEMRQAVVTSRRQNNIKNKKERGANYQLPKQDNASQITEK